MKNWFKKNKREIIFNVCFFGAGFGALAWMLVKTGPEKTPELEPGPPLTDEQLAEIVSWASGVEYEQVLADVKAAS